MHTINAGIILRPCADLNSHAINVSFAPASDCLRSLILEHALSLFTCVFVQININVASWGKTSRRRRYLQHFPARHSRDSVTNKSARAATYK